jgi:hypothetical protein
MNNKGQFSIIAALLVAIVLIAAVMTTYSAIRYGVGQQQPQILSAIDETNLGLKEVLGFTVGYYGSVLKVTGNMTYAQQLATNYLKSGLNNLAGIRPEWGAAFTLNNLTLSARWFSNQSYSRGSFTVNYNLTGIGIFGISYSTSVQLDVKVRPTAFSNQTQLTILRDEDEPLINLGRNNLKFYSYDYVNSTWQLAAPLNIASYADGTYILDLPPGVIATGYVIQVEDTRGLMVLASSFTQFTSKLTWNATSFRQNYVDYTDTFNLITGTESNSTAQQSGPDSINDTLTEQAFGLGTLNYYPTSYTLLGSTTLAQTSGNVTVDTNSDNSNYFVLRSYPSSFSTQNNSIGYSTKGGSYQNIENRITGSLFTTVTGGQVQSVSANIYSSAGSNRNAKVAIYQASDKHLVGSSAVKAIVPGDNGWASFSFTTLPLLNANTNYILVVWSESGSGEVRLYYDTGTSNQGYSDSETFGTWPDPGTNLVSDSNRKYSINCTYIEASQYTAEAEFTAPSDSINWQQLTWAVDSAVSAGTANCTMQLYNFGSSQYPNSGEGYMNTTLTTTDALQTQNITINPTNYRNATTYWKLKIFATNTSAAQFDLKLDLAQFTSRFTNYALNLQEQWLTVNASNVRQDLCIKTGSMGTEPLLVQVYSGGVWKNLMTLSANYFNNVSLAPYIDSSTLLIRFVGSNDVTDPTPDSWNIDCTYIKDQPDVTFLVNLSRPTFTIEVLQNGTMRWIGQNMQVTTQTLPVPPISVKAIHVNETVNGINREVPFQIEDWASTYQIPLGLTSNTTVFGSRQMVVLLVNSTVSDFTVWWDGSDNATQTAMAYTNRYFTGDNPSSSTLTNGYLNLFFSGGTVKSTVTSTSTYSTATFMRINDEASSYGSGCAYVIHHGIVRDIVQQEAEWSTGPNGAPNVYSNIIVTLPANANYYTYQLRLMFVASGQSRTITDLCPIQLAPSANISDIQTENGTLAGFPLLQSGAGTFPNYAVSGWTAHHFSQFLIASAKGAGIMFSDNDNQRLYALDSFSGSTSKGGIKTSTTGLELLPVSSGSVQFQNAYDITWTGAIATFDSNTPVVSLYDATTPMGLWLLAEYPPTLTVSSS